MRRYFLATLALPLVALLFLAWNSSTAATSIDKLGNSPQLNTYNAVNEFSLTQGGTSGVWGYGYTQGPTDNSFTPMPNAGSVGYCGGSLDDWTIGGSNPSIARNPGAPISGCGIRIPPDAIYMHPGEGGVAGDRAVVRWTAPAAGTYQLTGVFEGLQSITTSDVTIVKNATAPGLFTGIINGGAQQPFQVTVTVAQNDTIDFSVGCNGACGNDSTGLAVVIGPPVTSCATPPAGLNVWVPGEDSPADIESQNFNASLAGNATYTTGVVGRAMSFDGNGSYATIPDNPAQEPATQITVEGWWNVHSLAGSFPTFFAKGLRGSSDDSYTMWYDNGNIRIGFEQVGVGFVYIDTGYVPQLNVWNHYALVVNTTASGNTPSTMVLYVNGVQVATTHLNQVNPIYYNGINDASTPYPLTIGADINQDAPTAFLNSDADEVSVYGRALSQSEIFGIYQHGSFGKCSPPRCVQPPSGLVSWWQGEGNALDSKSQNHGSMVNGATFGSGETGRAFSFNGANQYMLVGDPIPGSLQLQNEISLEAWIYVTGYPSNNLAMIAGSQRDGTFSGASFFLDGRTNPDGQTAPPGHIHFQFGDGVNFVHATNTNSQVPLNQWVHIVATRKANQPGKVYYNGVLQPSTSAPWDGTVSYNSAWFAIGQQKDLDRPFNGLIDEVAIYNRELTPSEIQSHVDAGQSGMCRPVGSNGPANLAAWYAGGNYRDVTGNNPDGIPNGNVTRTAGRVDSAYNLDGSGGTFIDIPDAPAQRPASALTAEGWFYIRDRGNSSSPTLIAKPLHGTNSDSYTVYFFGNTINAGHGTTGAFDRLDSGFVPYLNQWYHIAYVIDTVAQTQKIYVNGSQVASGATTLPLSYDPTPYPLMLGADRENDSPAYFINAKIDEFSLYSRALSADEIASIYNAGAAGKLKSSSTVVNIAQSITSSATQPLLPLKGPKAMLHGGARSTRLGSAYTPSLIASPTTVTLSDATVTFAQVTTPGVTTESGIDVGLLPPLPAGATFTGLAYDISTTALYQNGNLNDVQVCFDLSSLTGSFTAANLAIYHLESGSWVNRTASGGTLANMCTNGVTSLSPFVIAVPAATSAASVSVSGRILTADGAGLRNAMVMMTDANGKTRRAVSNTFGYYSFTDVAAGGSYTFVVSARRFAFAPQIVNLRDQMTGLDFRALY